MDVAPPVGDDPPCTLVCTATLAEMKSKTFWGPSGEKSEIKDINIDCPKAKKKTLDLFYSNVRGGRGKKAEWIDFDA